MYCPQCGNTNPDDAAFCRVCGADLRNYKKEWGRPAPATEWSAQPDGSLAAAATEPEATPAQAQQPAPAAQPGVRPQPPPYQQSYQPGAYQATPYQPASYQPAYRPGYGYQLAQVPSHLAWAIVTLILCFWPTGIVAVVYASQVGNRLSLGDVVGAQDSSRKAKMWCWITFGIGVALWVLGIIFFILLVFTAVRTGVDNSF